MQGMERETHDVVVAAMDTDYADAAYPFLTALSFKIWSHSRKMCYFIAVAVWTQGCFNL